MTMASSLIHVIVFLGAFMGFINAQNDLHESTYLLESHPGYSLVLPLNHVGNSNMSFVVQSPRFHKVMAVIQFANLPLRNDFSCGSYLQFQDGVDKVSDRICGNFDPDEKDFQPTSLVGPRSYLSSRDSLRVSLVDNGQKIYARIAFTAYREDCYYTPRGYNLTTAGLPRYRPCSYGINSDGIGTRCIISSLFCDQVVHCASGNSGGQDFGEDESEVNCPHQYQIKESFTTSNSNEETANTSNNSSANDNGQDDGRVFKKFFDEREERLANIFKSAIIGFVGICTVCILIAFVISMFCLKHRYDSQQFTT